MTAALFMTHWPGCWKEHQACAVALLTDAIEILVWGAPEECDSERRSWFDERYPDGPPCTEEDCWPCEVDRFLTTVKGPRPWTVVKASGAETGDACD